MLLNLAEDLKEYAKVKVSPVKEDKGQTAKAKSKSKPDLEEVKKAAKN